MKKLTGFLAIPFAVLVMCWLAFAGPVVMQQSTGGAGSGDIATDTIWNAAGDLVQGSEANTGALLTAGTAGAYLRSGGPAAANVWSTLILPNAGTAYKLPVYSAANTMTELLAVGASGEVLVGNTGAIPSWLAAGATGKILIAKGAAAPEWTPYTMPAAVPTTGYGLISDGTNLVATSSAFGTAAYTASTAYQASSATLTSLAGLTETNGGIPYGTADNAYAWLAAGAEGKVLTGHGAAAPTWETPTVYQASSATLSSLAGLTETAGGIPYGTADNTYAWLAAGATTEILVGGGAAAPVWTTATGTGAPARATSPVFVTPTLGAALGTSIALGVDPAAGGTIMLTSSASIKARNSEGTGDVGLIATNAAEAVLIGSEGASGVTITPNTIVTGTLSAGAAGFSVDATGGVTGKSFETTRAASDQYVKLFESTGDTGDDYIQLTATGGSGASDNATWSSGGGIDNMDFGSLHLIVEGVTSTGATGTAGIVFSDSPTFVDDVSIAAAGVKLTGSNGSLTILGLGDGQDEDVKIDLNTTANTITVSSPASSATAMNFSALNLVTTGTISAGIPIQDDANGRNLTAAECYGYLHVASGAGTWLLPGAAAGMNLCVLVTGASDVIIDVDAADDVTLVGVQDTDGDGITNATGSSSGDFVCMIAIDATHWYVMGKQGTWTAQ